jgi:hypothetical protein
MKKKNGSQDPPLQGAGLPPGAQPGLYKINAKAPSVADAELDGLLALAARDRENSPAPGDAFI